MIESIDRWYQYKVPKCKKNALDEIQIEELFDFCEKLYIEKCECFIAAFRQKDLDSRYLFKLMNSGTYGDKISSLILLVQKSSIYSLNYLRQLIGMIKLANKRISLEVIENFQELLITNLLPPHRKLKTFIQQQCLSHVYDDYKKMNDDKDFNFQHEMLCLNLYFEHCFKREIYEVYINKLLEFSHDQIPHSKFMAIKAMTDLLVNVPEGEIRNLKGLIDKLADPNTNVAHLSSKCLKEQIYTKHPGMVNQSLIQIQSLLFSKILQAYLKTLTCYKKIHDDNHKNNKKINKKATLLENNIQKKLKGFETSLLNILTFLRNVIVAIIVHNKAELLNEISLDLIRIYFGIFKEILKVSASSTKIFQTPVLHNRENRDVKDIETRKSKRVVEKKTQSIMDFVSPKVLNSLFLNINKTFPHLNPDEFSRGEILSEINLFFTLANQLQFNNEIEILVFLFRVLFQTKSTNENESTDIIIVKNENSQSSKLNGYDLPKTDIDYSHITTAESIEGFKDRFFRCLYRKIIDPQFKVSHKQDKLFNLLYLSVQNDMDHTRIRNFLKRLLIISLNSPTPFIVACLILLYETTKKLSGSDLNTFTRFLFPNITGRSHDEELEKSLAPAYLSARNAVQVKFDFQARDPKYAGECEMLYEFFTLSRYFHPSVRLYVTQILETVKKTTSTSEIGKLNYHGDPLANFALHNFLEHFIRKNPKSENFESFLDREAYTKNNNNHHHHYYGGEKNAQEGRETLNITKDVNASQIAARQLREKIRKIKKAKKLSLQQNNETVDEGPEINTRSTDHELVKSTWWNDKFGKINLNHHGGHHGKSPRIGTINFADEFISGKRPIISKDDTSNTEDSGRAAKTSRLFKKNKQI